MSPEAKKFLPAAIVKAVENGLVSLIMKGVWLLLVGILAWGVWSLKGVASTYVDTHPTIIYLKTQAEQEKSAVSSTQATVREISTSIDRLERVMTVRFDKSDAAILRLDDRLNRHMEKK